MTHTKRRSLAAALCLALCGYATIPAIATEPAAQPAEAAGTYRLAIAGMT